VLHVLTGERESLEQVESASADGSTTLWIVPKKARPDDQVALYFHHRQAFVAHGEVVSNPEPTEFRRRPGYSAQIGNLVLLTNPVPLAVISELWPGWQWPTYPRSFTTPPAEVQASLLAELDSRGGAPRDYQPVLEGLSRESTVLRRSRNRRLRDEALLRARGVCEGCGTDYSRFLGGKGVVVLQVHHRDQLSVSAVPRVTHVDDLSVLCANCHALVHANRAKALPLQELRASLPQGWRHGG
jgi:hypothetical protein